VQAPDATEQAPDGTVHYLKRQPGPRGRYLRVVVNPRQQPPRIATAFFDARLRRREQQGGANQRGRTYPGSGAPPAE
jgi:hypothetical protein